MICSKGRPRKQNKIHVFSKYAKILEQPSSTLPKSLVNSNLTNQPTPSIYKKLNFLPTNAKYAVFRQAEDAIVELEAE